MNAVDWDQLRLEFAAILARRASQHRECWTKRDRGAATATGGISI